MAVFRVARINDYTVMSNFHLRDKRLSLKAKGLLSQMLSLPENWDYTLTGLCYINKESKDAIGSPLLIFIMFPLYTVASHPQLQWTSCGRGGHAGSLRIS